MCRFDVIMCLTLPSLYFVYLFVAKFGTVYIHSTLISITAIWTTKALRIDFLEHTLRQNVKYCFICPWLGVSLELCTLTYSDCVLRFSRCRICDYPGELPTSTTTHYVRLISQATTNGNNVNNGISEKLTLTIQSISTFVSFQESIRNF